MENPFATFRIKKKSNHLEVEKADFLDVLCQFVDGIDFWEENQTGRPRINTRDILKALLVMSYHSWSYRRSNSDIEKMKEESVISYVPKRATLNKYMRDPEFKQILERLVELSALSFVELEQTIIIDSTWFCNMIRLSSAVRYKANRNVNIPPLEKTRKLHIVIGLKSKIIISARTSFGTVHDINFFKELLENTIKLGIRVKTLLADAAYNSKDNYILCENYGIEAFLDFKKNASLGRDRSSLRRKQLILYKSHPELWHQSYNYRPIVEGVFSVMKRKGKNYIRGRQEISQDCEILLRVLWYNLTIISKHYH